MNVLITGGCGFIGSNLIEFHLSRGDRVHIVDDLSTGTLENILLYQHHPALHVDQADILTWPDLEKGVQWADRIYHLAAIVGVFRVLSEPSNVIKTNVLGCERLLNAAAIHHSHAQIIVASTSSVYGNSNKALLSESDDLTISYAQSLNAYSISKITDEILCQAYSKAANLSIIVVRLFNTIGPRQTGRYGMVVPRFIQQACHNEPITVFGDGNQTRSFCDVRDVIASLDILANKNNNDPIIVNVGNDDEITINDLATLVHRLANSHSTIQHISYHEAYGTVFSGTKRRRPDLTKFFQLTGYKHKWSLDQTIMELISRFKTA